MFYSLEKTNDNGVKKLKKTKYIKDKDDYSIDSESIFNVKFEDLEILGSSKNITVNLELIGSKSREIDFSIFLENIHSVSLDEKDDKVYYAYNIGSNLSEGDPKGESWSNNKKYEYGDIVVYNNQRYKSIKENGNNIQNQPPKKGFWEKLE